jgi:hypothetical protein
MMICAPLFAWGPHTEIAQAALDAIGGDDPLVQTLGPDAKRLSQYVWMADWRQQLLVRPDEVFYTDDYLLFPAATRHYQHICPEVKQTYAPYFRRALQALRTESTRNAARWIGSLLHFTTDTGSPPHAAEILGPVHSKMENWVNAKLIHLPGYQPQLLGADDAAAEAAFLRRMDGLIEFSKERAQRCRADIDADHREAVEPVVLESALETARVTADLLHTLGVLTAQSPGGTTLTGKVIAPKMTDPSLSRLPAKIILLGSNFSTLAEPDGSFVFRNLPAGEYRVVASVPSRVSEAKAVTLKSSASQDMGTMDLSGETDENLIRNSKFTLRWISDQGFDDWSLRNPPAKLGGKSPVRDWEGEWIPLRSGESYQLTAQWKAPAGASDSQVFLRTKAKLVYGSLQTDSAPVTSENHEVSVTGSTDSAWAQVCIRSAQSPDAVLDTVRLRPLP